MTSQNGKIKFRGSGILLVHIKEETRKTRLNLKAIVRVKEARYTKVYILGESICMMFYSR
jgi:hypothetical protein